MINKKSSDYRNLEITTEIQAIIKNETVLSLENYIDGIDPTLSITM